MTDIRALLVLVCIAISSAAGCGEPGVVSVSRIPGTAGGGSNTSGMGQGISAAGSAAGESAGPCPSGWTCNDLGALGLAATDGDGKPVMFTCGMGGIMPCDDANPAGTCAGLTKPFCAHVDVSGMKIVSCAQRCTP